MSLINVSHISQSQNCINVSIDDEAKEFIKVTSYHISCKSIPKNKDNDEMIGIILYKYDDKTKWELNGVRCQSGYIYLVPRSTISTQKSVSMFNECFKALFGCKVNNKINIIARVFAYQQSDNSLIYDDKYEITKIEKYWITKLIRCNGKCQTIYLRVPVWSWMKNGKWVDYPADTIKVIEENYKTYINKCLKNANGVPLKDCFVSILNNNYRIWFKTEHILLKDKNSINHSSHPQWKNDLDTQNAYFMQESMITRCYRIVRRKNY